MEIQPYLFFEGRCQEALDFYQEVLDAEVLYAMRFGESPEPPPEGTLPPGFEDKIMHANVRVGETVFMASDGTCGATESGFRGFSLSISVPDEVTAERIFEALADGGKVELPLDSTFWSPCFGMLTDRFGVGWMVGIFTDELADA